MCCDAEFGRAEPGWHALVRSNNKLPLMKTRLGYIALILLIGAIAASCVTTISPSEMTQTAISETTVRIHMYLIQHRDYPKDLSVLPKRDRYANQITDGWGRPLIYNVDEKGVISLKSLGRDGKVGGDGPDQDIVRQHRTRNADGTLNIDDDLWLVTSVLKSE